MSTTAATSGTAAAPGPAGAQSVRRRRTRPGQGWHLRVPFWAAIGFLYLPILVVTAMSFNASSNLFSWSGFSLKWYAEVFRSPEILASLGNTLVVAAAAAVLATVLGTLTAVGIHRYTKGGLIRAIAIAPAMLPDLLLAIGLLSLFTLLNFTLGLLSVILAHTVFAMAFVTAIVLARLAQVDPSLEEASRDLGASPARTLLKVTVPQLGPAIISGGLLAFTLSLDEFVIAFFTTSPTVSTLPINIYSMVRFGVSPEINALATMLLGLTVLAVLGTQRLTKIADSL